MNSKSKHKSYTSQAGKINRRDFLNKTSAASLGLGAMTLGASGLWTPLGLGAEANAPSALVVIFLNGGCDGARLWGGVNLTAGAGAFGVTTATTVVLNPTETDATNRVAIDRSLDTLNPFVKAHFGVVGVAHGITAHGPARTAHMTAGGRNGLLALGAAMGGSGPIKVAAVGAELPPGPTAAVEGVSLQQINDMQSTIDALGGGAPDPTMPKRELAAQGIAGAESMSKSTLAGNKDSLVTLANGYSVAQASLKKAAQTFNPQELRTAYNLTGTAVNSMMAKMAAAELMINAGTNVVVMADNGWDTHGDTTGARVRGAFSTRIFPALKLFTDRMVNEQSAFNVHVMILGDFNRSAPGSDHAGTSSVAVMGPRIKTGSTGNIDAQIRLPAGTPTIEGLWGLVGQVSGGTTVATKLAPGGNPHTRLIV